jgi:hypothetical protein
MEAGDKRLMAVFDLHEILLLSTPFFVSSAYRRMMTPGTINGERRVG